MRRNPLTEYAELLGRGAAIGAAMNAELRRLDQEQREAADRLRERIERLTDVQPPAPQT